MACILCKGLGMCASPGDWRENGGWETCPMCCPPKPEPPREPGFLRRVWRWFLARHRIDLELVCELSRGRGTHNDFHDYPDSERGYPDHFIELKCKRCGKLFCI